MRRLLAAASLAALGLSLAVPVAFAHTDPNVHTLAWGSSPDPTTANDDGQVYSNDEVVAAVADFDDGVRSWDVVIRPVNGGQPSSCHEDLGRDNGGNGKYPSKVYINCPWDTTRATNHSLPSSTPPEVATKPVSTRAWQSQDLGPSVNGKYTVEITVYNSGQDFSCGLLSGCQHLPVEPHSLYQSGSNPPRWREVWVVNGVADPTGVNSGFDPASNKISVTWAPNPEADVSYVVQEKVGDGKWSAGAAVPGNAHSYDRVIDQPGKYQYQVGAVRPAPTSNSGKGASVTKKSGYVASQAVDIAVVSPPTTAGTNGPDGSANGGDPGVFMPGDTPSTTAPGSHVSGPAKGSSAAGRSGGTGIVSRPSGTSSRSTGSTAPAPGEAEGEGIDEGFSPALPYTQGGTAGDGLGAGDSETPESMSPIVTVPRPRDTRALLIPMAGSLVLFVFAMQVTVAMRRRPAMATMEDDFGDWMGY
jgi:hypothetical protein